MEIPVSDVQAVKDQLDNLGDDGYSFDNCCGNFGGSCAIVGTHGFATVSFCGHSRQCIGCAILANYVRGLIYTCQSDGVVSGTQNINEALGLTVELDFNTH